jgi:Mn-dependent DtxR family transcriptional regulator
MTHQKGTTTHALQIARNAKRQIIMASTYIERGEPFLPGDICKLLGVQPVAAAHLLSGMAREGMVEMVQIRNKKGLLQNTYRTRKPSILNKVWRRHPNFHPMPSRWMLGAPI